MKTKTKKKPKKLETTPKVTASKQKRDKKYDDFPVGYYHYSMMSLFSSNPFMFKVNYINGDVIETTTRANTLLGKAIHKGMEAYFGGGDYPTPADEGEAIKAGYEAGKQYLETYSDGFIEWTATIPDRAKLTERYAFAYFGYQKEAGYGDKKVEVLLVEKKLKHTIETDGKLLPIPLVSRNDLVIRENGEIVIEDHKFTARWSDEEKIDGAKLLQAAVSYFTVGAELGEVPKKMRFREMKVTENRDKKEPQMRVYDLDFEEMPLMFDFFFRFYEDMTNALLGHQVYVPNINALFDNEVALLAYIHRLDMDEVKARALKQARVDNITEFLKKKIVKTKSLKQFEQTIAKHFISAKTLNYKNMTMEEKIKMKLAEHGISTDYDSKIVGPTVTLYRYEPAIGVKMSKVEAYTKDIELVTQAAGVRILAPIPGTGLIGFEVPNKQRTYAGKAPQALNQRMPIGVDIQGEKQYVSLREAPHVLIAGSTGSGKSVAINAIIGSLGKTVDLWLLDPKKVELAGIPAKRYEDTTEGIHGALKDLVDEMESRYGKMKGKEKEWSGRRIVAIIDEFADLMVTSRESRRHSKADASIQREAQRVKARREARMGLETQVEAAVEEVPAQELILRLASKGRAAGIHLIIATQSPRVDIITGSIKANFPTRIALRTASPTDSEVILGQKGAEKLCGKGDMLLMRSDSSELVRLQGFEG